MTSPHLNISSPIAEALQEGRAVVALESTIITHGMPYPRNVETALAVRATIAERGAVHGYHCHHRRQNPRWPDRRRDRCPRPSRRSSGEGQPYADLAFSIAQASVGGTTVAATMMLAAMAGIRVFATGGIGGVHRGAGTSFDVSADLQELARTNVVVVCAGPKSILDLGLTLEYLETHGVPVIGFGTDIVPAFYGRDSDFAVDYRIDDAVGVAAVMRVRRELGIQGGMLVTSPIPVEHGMDRTVIDAAIDTTIIEADAQRIVGKETSPFLLGRIVELTGGASLDANVQLVLNNARVAADIAIADSDN